MKIARDEIFGPVMSILRLRNVDDVIRRGNQKTVYVGLS
jgi:acyl-CoA reductase-like NAD-dependent aldehyde dehydrogenase